MTLALKAAGAHVATSDYRGQLGLSVWSIPATLEGRSQFGTANLPAVAVDPTSGVSDLGRQAAGPQSPSQQSPLSDAASFKARFAAASLSTVSRLVEKTEPILAHLASANSGEPEAPEPARSVTKAVDHVAASSSERVSKTAGRHPLVLASLGNGVPSGLQQKENSSTDIDARTAIYDIGAHAVYLPDGRRLEAHSGLGGYLDDTRYVSVKHLGPTPPNVYRLALREHLFHGVRAIRLIPVAGSNMFGRDGMLVHTYMLGPNGQSNGCVSIADYSVFLDAFLKGNIDRLVVVEHRDDPGSTGSAIAAGWFTKAVKEFFKPFGA